MEQKQYARLTYEHYIDAAHQLKDSKFLVTKKCAQLHGHTYKIIVKLAGRQLQGGMITDFSSIKIALDILDHKFINDVFKENGWGNKQPTAENIAFFYRERLEMLLGDSVNVESVGVCEGWKGKDNYIYV